MDSKLTGSVPQPYRSAFLPPRLDPSVEGGDNAPRMPEQLGQFYNGPTLFNGAFQFTGKGAVSAALRIQAYVR